MGRRGDPGFAGSLGARRLHPGLFLGVAALSGLRMEVAWAEEVSALRGSCAAIEEGRVVAPWTESLHAVKCAFRVDQRQLDVPAPVKSASNWIAPPAGRGLHRIPPRLTSFRSEFPEP